VFVCFCVHTFSCTCVCIQYKMPGEELDYNRPDWGIGGEKLKGWKGSPMISIDIKKTSIKQEMHMNYQPRAHIHIGKHTRTQQHRTATLESTYTCEHTYTRTRTHTHAHLHSHPCSASRWFSRKHIRKHIRINKHKDADAHTDIDIDTDTDTHTHLVNGIDEVAWMGEVVFVEGEKGMLVLKLLQSVDHNCLIVLQQWAQDLSPGFINFIKYDSTCYNIPTCMQIYIHAYTNMRTYQYIDAYSYLYTHTYTYIHIHTHTQARVWTHIHTHTHTYTRTQARR